MRSQAILFDLDGTLIDSLRDIAAAMNAALAARGLPIHPEDAYREMVGEGARVLVQRSAPGAELDALVADFRRRYFAALTVHTRAYPGIDALLDELVRREVPLAVLSNKPDVATRELVTLLFPCVPWRAVAGEVASTPRKPDPSAALAIAARVGVPPAAWLFVGDTPTDLQTAAAAGMRSVGVTWGFRDPAELAGADHLVHAPAELLALVA